MSAFVRMWLTLLPLADVRI